MSKRAIKRYEEAQKLQSQPQQQQQESDDELLVSSKNNSTSVSMFQLLGVEHEQSDDDDDSENEQQNIQNLTESIQQSNQSTQKKGKKRKKKKNKKRNDSKNQTIDRDNDPDWIALRELSLENDQLSTFIPDSLFNRHDTKEIREEAQRIFKLISNQVTNDSSSQSDSISHHMTQFGLKVEPRHLNADSELKKRFGSRAVESERRQEEENLNQAIRRRGNVKRIPNFRKKFSLVTPRENWITGAPGLRMVLDEEATNSDPDGIRYFHYIHEGSYKRVQDEYLLVVQQHDPNQLVQLINHHPYHVDTILQLAEIYRQMGELDRAAEFVEMSLYILETTWNFSFKPFDGSCRMKFDVIENRPLFVALFRYSQLLTRRGLHRTSLEISKLLLNLDPDHDPMGVLMTIDSFALLSKEYQWLIDMAHKYTNLPIRFFPNFAASEALAIKALHDEDANTKRKTDKQSTKPNPSSQESSNPNHQSPREILIDVLLTYPMILKPILSAIDDTSNVYLDSRLYDENWHGSGYDDRGILTRICRVHAERCKLLWKAPQNREMLISCAREAGKLDEDAGTGIDPITQQQTSAVVEDEEKHPRVARCRRLRAEAGNWLRDSGLYAEIQIADFIDSTTNIPAQLLAQDPPPPLPRNPAPERTGDNPPAETTPIERAIEFFASMAPWRDTPNPQ